MSFQVLSSSDLRALLRLAAESVRCTAEGGEPDLPQVPARLSRLRAGLFVSLFRDQDLAGCLGVVRPREDMAASVVDLAAAAAVEDFRFDPIAPEELNDLWIELSVLSEPIQTTAERFELGEEGLILTHARGQGLLLPQVASEHGLDRAGFLEALAEKAGLGPGGWKEASCELQAFRVRRARARWRDLVAESGRVDGGDDVE